MKMPYLVSIPLWFSRNTVLELYRKSILKEVSIPLWFSRNEELSEVEIKTVLGFHTTMVLTQQKTIKDQDAVLVTFPYHYGSYATCTVSIGSDCVFCFHTTMVLTQLVRYQSGVIVFFVSIPLWFLRNYK